MPRLRDGLVAGAVQHVVVHDADGAHIALAVDRPVAGQPRVHVLARLGLVKQKLRARHDRRGPELQWRVLRKVHQHAHARAVLPPLVVDAKPGNICAE